VPEDGGGKMKAKKNVVSMHANMTTTTFYRIINTKK